jgi:hypothetical protein
MSEENVKEKEKLVAGPGRGPDTKTDWPTDCRSQRDSDFDLESFSELIVSLAREAGDTARTKRNQTGHARHSDIAVSESQDIS